MRKRLVPTKEACRICKYNLCPSKKIYGNKEIIGGAKITLGLFFVIEICFFYKKAMFCKFIYLSMNSIKDRALNSAHYLRFATKNSLWFILDIK